MTRPRVVLAFAGTAASCAAVKWLSDRHRADVSALVVDVGQADDLEQLRARAVACGAARAHVVDRRDAFARGAIVPLAAAPGPVDGAVLRRLAHPVVAAALVDVAAVEGAAAVAHASTGRAFDAHVRAVGPAVRVLAPAREWAGQGLDVAAWLAGHGLPAGVVRAERHLLMRRPGRPAAAEARVTIGFAAGLPVSINDVAMGLGELIESLSLIGGQYAAGDAEAPALDLLRAAYRGAGGAGAATLRLQPSAPAAADAGARETLVGQP